MDAFGNESTLAFLKAYRGKNIRIFDNKYQPRIDETVKILYDPDKGSEAMRNSLRMIQEGKRVAFVMTSCKKARALANQASKLQKPDGSPILTRVYFGQMDGKQCQEDFADINATWSGLDCIIYTSTVEAGDIGGKNDSRDWGMDNADWVKLCDIDFVKIFNNSEPLQHFRRLAYFRRQGSNAIKALENLKFKETIQWEESQDSLDPASNDLHKYYSVKQWEAVHNLFQSLGFTGIDDERILSGDDVAKAFKELQEKIIKIRQDALLLFGFKSRAKGTPDLNATIKFINAVVGNWCGYAIKSKRKREGPKGQQVWKQIYWIDRKPYSETGFNEARAPILPPYKPESVNEIQELFDSIPITDTNSKFTD
ncbi:13410_t:CDS:2 [Entrophospora sp. SA101]|nr:13410_t:CDS:2 [Entrophospora sp. SA101]